MKHVAFTTYCILYYARYTNVNVMPAIMNVNGPKSKYEKPDSSLGYTTVNSE